MFGLFGSRLLLKRLFSLISEYITICVCISNVMWIWWMFQHWVIAESVSAHKKFSGVKNYSLVCCHKHYFCASNLPANIIHHFPWSLQCLMPHVHLLKSLFKNLATLNFSLWNHMLNYLISGGFSKQADNSLQHSFWGSSPIKGAITLPSNPLIQKMTQLLLYSHPTFL